MSKNPDARPKNKKLIQQKEASHAFSGVVARNTAKSTKLKQVLEGIQSKKKNDVKKEYWIIGILLCLAVAVSLFFLFGGSIEKSSKQDIKPDPRQDYIYTYNGYDFWKDDDGFWNTRMTKHGDIDYVATFYFGPRDLEDINITYHNNTFADQLQFERKAYITFDPEDDDLQYVAVSASSLAIALKKVYFTEPTAACTKQAEGCANKPIVTCETTQDLVIFVKQDPELSVVYKDNCLTIKGSGEDLIRATNKVLFGWYGIIE